MLEHADVLDLPIFENVKIVFLQARNKIALRVARGYVEHDEVHVDRDRAVLAEKRGFAPTYRAVLPPEKKGRQILDSIPLYT